MSRVKIGIVDSGFRAGCIGSQQVVKAQAFVLEEGKLYQQPATDDVVGHGSALLEVIAKAMPEAEFYIAQVFHARLTTSAIQVSEALKWLAEQGVAVINLSLGLRQDRPELRQICEQLAAQNILLCASTPARGEPVYPAAYEGVLRMTGDARCAQHEISALHTRYADFGAHVKVSETVIGASAGCAFLTAEVAKGLAENPAADRPWVIAWLNKRAHYHGIEQRPTVQQKVPHE